MSARYHLICGETIQLWVVNQHDRVAERQGNVQVVCGKQDTLSFLLRQLPEKQTEFVAVGQVEKRGGFVQ